MDWNFFTLVKELGFDVGDIEQAPKTTGYYRLFKENGEFIYVGKANDLHQRLSAHFGPNEKNELIKDVAKYAIWQPTLSIDEAEEKEGNLYDTWVRHTGQPPYANKKPPPKSKLRDSNIRSGSI